MASAKACGSAQAYEEQHKAVVTLMCNTANQLVIKHCHQHGASTGGVIKNLAKADCVKFLSKHEWAGRSMVPYPHTITKNHSGTFVHSSACHGHNDEAAVVYSDDSGSAWLMAWSVKDRTGCGNHNKVYVEAGKLDDFVAINWNDIKAKLDNSCDTSYYVDDTTGCEIFGKITAGNKASLVVTLNSY